MHVFNKQRNTRIVSNSTIMETGSTAQLVPLELELIARAAIGRLLAATRPYRIRVTSCSRRAYIRTTPWRPCSCDITTGNRSTICRVLRDSPSAILRGGYSANSSFSQYSTKNARVGEAKLLASPITNFPHILSSHVQLLNILASLNYRLPPITFCTQLFLPIWNSGCVGSEIGTGMHTNECGSVFSNLHV